MSSWDDVGKTWCVAVWDPRTNGWVYGPRAVPYSRRHGTGAHYDYELSSAASGLTASRITVKWISRVKRLWVEKNMSFMG